MQAIRERADQMRTLKALIRFQESLFDVIDRYEPDTAVRLAMYKGRADLEEYYMNIRFSGDTLGIFLWGPSIDGKTQDKWVLGIATLTPERGITAGLLCIWSKEAQVLHDGRVYAPDGRGRPFLNEPKVEVDDRKYYSLGSIEDRNLFPRIVEFHQNRLNELLGESSVPKGGSGLDPGPSKKSIRLPVVVDARHFPITLSLYKEMSKCNFERESCEMRPDLLVKKGKMKIMFEVKPKATLHDLIMACGQLLVYNESACADVMVIVTERLHKKNEYLDKFLSKSKIHILSYEYIGSTVVFADLEILLSSIITGR